MAVLLLLVGLCGLAVGSFLTVVVHRVPLGLSVVTPASRCPSCAHPVRARDTLPVLGWLLLRGRCAHCQAGIAVRYPVLELLTGVLFVLVTWRAVQLGQAAAVPLLLAFTALGVALSGIDLAERRLPDVLVLPAYPALAMLVAGACLVRTDPAALGRSLLGAAGLFSCFLLMAVASPAAMGFGDVKLAGVIGLVLGYLSWSTLLVGAFAGFFLGALAGVALLAGGRGRKATIAFGPFMVAGALLALWLTGPVGSLVVPR